MELSEVQIELIRQQWRELAKDKKENGVAVFIMLFTEHPEYQEVFGMLQGLSLEQLQTSPKLKAHGLTFMHGVHAFVENLDDIDTLIVLLRKTAERHGARGISIQAFHHAWELFPKVLEMKLGDSFNEKAREAWSIAIKYMSQVIDEALASIEDIKLEAGGLSDLQIDLIRMGWDDLAKNKKQTGVELFVTFFEHFPQYQDSFVMLRGISLDELRTNHKMRAHGLTFMHGLHAIIDNLDDPECLLQLMRKNAERHAGRGITQHAFKDLFSILPVYLETKLGKHWDEDTREAWAELTDFMLLVTDRRIAEYNKDHGITEEGETKK